MKFEKFGKEKLKEFFSNACDPCISGYPECGGDQERAKSWSCPKFYNGLFTVVIKMTNFIVFENQLNKVGEFEERQEAIDFARKRHAQNMRKYHEVYKAKEGAMPSYGVAQWKPRDCPDCQRPCYVTHNIAEVAVYVCDHCDIEIPFRVEEEQ